MNTVYRLITFSLFVFLHFSCSDDGIDGLDGQSALVNALDEPPGENCKTGGIRIEIGIDLNSNSILDSDEVQNVSFVCDGESLADEGQTFLVITGDITNEEAQAKVDAEVGANTQLIIIKNTNQLTRLMLPQVEHLAEVQIDGNRALGTLDFPNLLKVDDRITFNNNRSDSLKVKMNSLNEVTGNIEFSNNTSLDAELNMLEKAFWVQIQNENQTDFELNLPLLREVLVIEISDNTGGFNFRFPELVELGDLYVNDNLIFDFFFEAPKLEQLMLLEVIGNEAIGASLAFSEVFDLSGVTEINTLLLQGDNWFTIFDLPNIQSFFSSNISSNDDLVSIDMENLSSVDNLIISSNDALTSVNLESLEGFGDNFNVSSNPFLTGLNIDAFTSTNDFFISLDRNAFSSATVNYVLARFVSITPPVSGVTLNLQQTPAAPPTGQGLTDKATLESNGNTINTD